MKPSYLGGAALLLAVLAFLAYSYWHEDGDALPDWIAHGNGRIEAGQVQVATKYPGRVAEVRVDEGDFVAAEDILAVMDTAADAASLAKARADVAKAHEAVAEAKALIALRQSELTLAMQDYRRTEILMQRGHATAESLDHRQAARDTATAALAAARARLASSERGVEAAVAEVHRAEIRLDDAYLRAPRDGRVQYRLAEPGEVLASGGRVLTLLDLSDVTMTAFLPTADAGRVFLGAEARIVLDAAPAYVIPAAVTFVAADAQFTPREVETRSEREKLMFRVKVRIAPSLLRAHLEKVKTGLPGEVFIAMGAGGEWPERLQVALPPEAK